MERDTSDILAYGEPYVCLIDSTQTGQEKQKQDLDSWSTQALAQKEIKEHQSLVSLASG